MEGTVGMGKEKRRRGYTREVKDKGGIEAPFMDPRYAPALTVMVWCLETKTVQDTDD